MREWDTCKAIRGIWHVPAARALVAAILAVMSSGSSSFAGSGDPAAGEKLYGNCKTCHEIGEGAHNKVGPHLDGIIGRKAASIEGFRYSGAMEKAATEGLVWSVENLDAYLQKPREFIPGNRMSFRGMSKEKDRADLIAWLQSMARAAPAADPARIEPDTHGPAREFTDIVLAMEGDRDYGEYLGSECVTCHQITGQVEGIPSIVGVPRDYFIRSLFEYKTNVRRNEVMKLRVANLGNEEIAALAEYFSSLEPQ